MPVSSTSKGNCLQDTKQANQHNHGTKREHANTSIYAKRNTRQGGGAAGGSQQQQQTIAQSEMCVHCRNECDGRWLLPERPAEGVACALLRLRLLLGCESLAYHVPAFAHGTQVRRWRWRGVGDSSDESSFGVRMLVWMQRQRQRQEHRAYICANPCCICAICCCCCCCCWGANIAPCIIMGC